jgi:hypothetical protein
MQQQRVSREQNFIHYFVATHLFFYCANSNSNTTGHESGHDLATPFDSASTLDATSASPILVIKTSTTSNFRNRTHPTSEHESLPVCVYGAYLRRPEKRPSPWNLSRHQKVVDHHSVSFTSSEHGTSLQR